MDDDAALLESYWPADCRETFLDLTLSDLLRRAAAEVPDRVALVEGIPDHTARRRWTYAQLLGEAERMARALLTRFRPGERVALYAPNCPEWVLLQHGMSLAGIVLVPLNPAYRDDEVAVILRKSDAVGIVYSPRFRDNDLVAIVAGLDLPQLRARICLSDLEAFLATAPDEAELPAIDPGEPLQIQYTSGTTGVPKGALLHHRGVVNTCRYVAVRAGFRDGGVWLNAMPMFHIGGSAVTSIGCLSHRGTYVLAPGFDPASTLELVESERAETMLVVPTMILALLDHPDQATRDLSSIRTVCSGAAAVPAALVTRTKAAWDCDFTILFGQTEINGVVCQTRITDSIEDQANTLGQPLPHVEVKVADPETGKVRPIGEIGEICVRGYQTMHGYYGEPEATAATLREDGWLHMGDLGTMDDRGYVRIAGRLKDMIIRGGMNLFPREIEDVVAAAPGVAQVAVVGVPDERWGEVVGAVVIPADPASPPVPDDLNAFCRDRLAAHKSPRHYFYVSGYPLTPSGKIQKFRLMEMVADGELVAVPWTPPDTCAPA
ncbi:MAG TPA: AMP-binding protein [Sporichthya sp.]|nr:AMP-binding protein [Sporichthya sp.]